MPRSHKRTSPWMPHASVDSYLYRNKLLFQTPPLVSTTQLWVRLQQHRLQDVRSTCPLFGITHTRTHRWTLIKSLTCQEYAHIVTHAYKKTHLRLTETWTHLKKTDMLTHTHTELSPYILWLWVCQQPAGTVMSDRLEQRQRRGKEEEGRQAGKMSTAECISKNPVCLDERVTDWKDCNKHLFGSKGSSPIPYSIQGPYSSPLSYKASFLVHCYPLLLLIMSFWSWLLRTFPFLNKVNDADDNDDGHDVCFYAACLSLCIDTVH